MWLNDREIGRTPVDVEFVHYGSYDVRLVKDGYEALLTHGKAKAPLWDAPGPDFAAEVMPVELHSDITWHYVLQPLPEDADAAAVGLLDRAHETREQYTAGEDGSPDPPSPPASAP